MMINATICSQPSAGTAAYESSAPPGTSSNFRSSDLDRYPGQRKPASVTKMPVHASIEMRPCLISSST
jgi:hypothetical protein